MKISVIMPIYNAEKYLNKCIQSVIDQTYTNWELIAIDDGSKDSSFFILSEFAVKDSRIKGETKKNEGPGVTRNRALDKATGDYVVFLDADDYIEPDYFKLLKERVEIENADVVFIDVFQETPDGRLIKYEKMSSFKSDCRKDMIGCQMTGYMPWGGWRKAASRSLIEKHHLRYTAQAVGEEAIFSFELLRHAKKISFIEKNLYHYINHSGSQSKTKNSTWETTLEKMKEHLEKEGIREEYDDCLNAFAFTVLISWLLRNSKKMSIHRCLSFFKGKVKEFETVYGWEIESRYMRKEVRILKPVVKMKILLPVVIAAKVVKK